MPYRSCLNPEIFWYFSYQMGINKLFKRTCWQLILKHQFEATLPTHVGMLYRLRLKRDTSRNKNFFVSLFATLPTHVGMHYRSRLKRDTSLNKNFFVSLFATFPIHIGIPPYSRLKREFTGLQMYDIIAKLPNLSRSQPVVPYYSKQPVSIKRYLLGC